jgi:hypothetical protein
MPKSTRIIHAPEVMDALMDTIRPYLSLDLPHTRITPELALQVLAYASVNGLTLEASCARLAQAPSGNRLREVLLPALPELPDLQRRLNTTLRRQLPVVLLKGTRDYEIAIDLTQVPYHGQPHADADEVMRGPAKAGTTHFHGYLTVSVVHTQRRHVLAVLFVRRHDSMADLVKRALKLVKRLRIRIRRVLLDAGFCAVEVFRTLARRHLSYIIPLRPRGKSGGVRKLLVGRRSYRTTYTLHSRRAGAYTVGAVVVVRYSKGRYQRHDVRRFAYAVAGLSLPGTVACRAVFQWYRRRFGIESSYRQMHQVRARTTSRHPGLRLLLIGLALILVNLYLRLRARVSECPARARVWLSLRRVGLLIAHALESLFGIAPVVLRRAGPLLS